MDNNAIRFKIQPPGTTDIYLADALYNAGTFCLYDLCWWVNDGVHWSANRQTASDLLQFLIKHKCCGQCSGMMFKKTKEFAAILKQIISISEIIESN